MAKLPAPKNTFVGIVKIILQKLIEGLGVDVAVTAATAEAPWLAWPVVKDVFRYAVGKLAESINDNLFKIAASVIIRIQNDGRKEEFDKAMEPFLKPEGPTDEEIQRAKDALDRMVNRNRT